QLGQAEGTVAALERALEAQRQACTLAPAVEECRQLLGWRYVQLARKLCELGRLPEAEARFRERQALWAGGARQQAEALGERRKWAAQVGEGKADLSPSQQRERQRYLDLCARLEERGGKAPAATQPR